MHLNARGNQLYFSQTKILLSYFLTLIFNNLLFTYNS